MPDYKETTVAGTSWQRARRVVIENQYAQVPTITFIEEKAINVEGQVITEVVDSIMCSFDSNSTLHTDIYMKLNELYVLLREARDMQ